MAAPQSSPPPTPMAALEPPPPKPLLPSLPGYLQEIELTQEFKDLISTLPIQKGWVANYLHQYQGFWHTTRQLQGVVSCQNHFQAHKSDIFLVTTPKSGTTWLKALMFCLMNRVQFHDFKNHPLLFNNPHVFVPFLEHQYICGNFPQFNHDPTINEKGRLLSTHLPLVSLPKCVEELGCKIVYLCRNPKDTFVSLWHFTNNLRPKEKGNNSLEDAFLKYCNGMSLYGPFWDHVLGYWKESLKKPNSVLFLKYEDMKHDPKTHLTRLSEFLECPFSLQKENAGVLDEILKLCSFENLSSLEINKKGKLDSGEENRTFFRRGEVGDSTNYLSEEMIEHMDRITEEKLKGSGLKL